MVKLGFPEEWIDRVMSCVTTPSFSVRINGKAYGNIIPSRGLCQGDPLSPYLLLLCAEGFTSLLSKAEAEGRLHGVQICRRAPSISNLLFANDSLIFCQANQEEVLLISEHCNYTQKLLDNALILRSLLLTLAVILLRVKSYGSCKLWE